MEKIISVFVLLILYIHLFAQFNPIDTLTDKQKITRFVNLVVHQNKSYSTFSEYSFDFDSVKAERSICEYFYCPKAGFWEKLDFDGDGFNDLYCTPFQISAGGELFTNRSFVILYRPHSEYKLISIPGTESHNCNWSSLTTLDGKPAIIYHHIFTKSWSYIKPADSVQAIVSQPSDDSDRVTVVNLPYYEINIPYDTLITDTLIYVDGYFIESPGRITSKKLATCIRMEYSSGYPSYDTNIFEVDKSRFSKSFIDESMFTKNAEEKQYFLTDADLTRIFNLLNSTDFNKIDDWYYPIAFHQPMVKLFIDFNDGSSRMIQDFSGQGNLSLWSIYDLLLAIQAKY